MQQISGTLQAYQEQLALIHQEGRAALARADAHLERANAWRVQADAELDAARVQLMEAEIALADAVEAAVATAGIAAPALAPFQAAVAAAEARVVAAQAEVARAEADQMEARREQQMAIETTRQRYAEEDGRVAAQLDRIQVPRPPAPDGGGGAPGVAVPGAVPGASEAAGGIFASAPGALAWDPPASAAGQTAENMCVPAGVQSVLGAAGVDTNQQQLAALLGTNADGTFYGPAVPAINAYLRQNPEAVARFVGAGTPAYDAVMAGQNLVTFQENVGLDQLAASTARGMPSLVPVRTAIGGLHNVTVYGVRNGYVQLFDPLPEPSGQGLMVPVDGFMAQWYQQRATVLTM
jgi:hypothetical protein